MGLVESTPSPHQEALGLLELLKAGRVLQTAAEALDLIRIPEKQKRFLSSGEIWYRKAVEAEFMNLLRPGTARMPERPPKYAPPPPPKPARPPTPLIEQAIIEALTELMAPAPPVQNLRTPPRPHRGPYRKRIPSENFASATIGTVARHFNVTVEDLITPGRGPSPGSGMPRWTCVLLLREGGMRIREIVDCLGYSDPAGPYMGLKNIAALRARDPAIDREISTLLESTDASMPGCVPNTPATQESASACAPAQPAPASN